MTDLLLKQDVIDAIDYEPGLDARHVAVSVDDGTVTLGGYVRTYADKCRAEEAVKRVKGVRAIAELIEVRPIGSHLTDDDEIARRAADLLRWHATVPGDTVQVKVEDGWVTLTGEVQWNYERSAAEATMRHLVGVRGVLNQIKIAPVPTAADIRERIVASLRRDAELDAGRITVKVVDHTVTLEGRVRTWAEREAAERAVWSAPGVTAIEDHLKVAA
jgi:osmotically-inducible protein OsmY